jgi:hypothetical protein
MENEGSEKFVAFTINFSPNEVPDSDVYGSRTGTAEDEMQDSKTYRQYAEDCRRIAQTMNANDKAVLFDMAKLWDERADEADRLAKGKTSQS